MGRLLEKALTQQQGLGPRCTEARESQAWAWGCDVAGNLTALCPLELTLPL